MWRLILKLVSLVFIYCLFIGNMTANAGIYDNISWSESSPQTGIIIKTSQSAERPSISIKKITPRHLSSKSLDVAALHDALLSNGLKFRSDIGLQDLNGGGLLVWGNAMAGSKRQKFMAKLTDSGLILLTASSRDFNPRDALIFFDGIESLHVTGQFSKRLADANVDLSRKPKIQPPAKSPSSRPKQNPKNVSTKNNIAWPKAKNPAEQKAVSFMRAAFPSAIAPAQIMYKHPNGTTQLALYQDFEGDFRFPNRSIHAPRYANLSANIPKGASGKDIRKAFARTLNELGIQPQLRSETLEAPEWRKMHGARYWAEFGEARQDGQQLRYFIDLYHNKIQIIVAPADVFDSWNGPLAPLVMNGYIKDPQNINRPAREGLADLTVNDQAKIYILSVNRKMQSSTFGFAATLNSSIMMALENGVTEEFRAATGNR